MHETKKKICTYRTHKIYKHTSSAGYHWYTVPSLFYELNIEGKQIYVCFLYNSCQLSDLKKKIDVELKENNMKKYLRDRKAQLKNQKDIENWKNRKLQKYSYHTPMTLRELALHLLERESHLLDKMSEKNISYSLYTWYSSALNEVREIKLLIGA